MGKKSVGRASTKDVLRRFEARCWLTDAILRGKKLGLDVAPAMDLLEALENLDYVEIVENLGTELEKVIASRCDGPANISLQPGQVLRIVGHVDPILTLPADGPNIVVKLAGGVKLTPAQEFRRAASIAFVDKLEKLGMSVALATKRVEAHLGPVANLRKKFHSGRYESLRAEYDQELRYLAGKSEQEVLARIQNAAILKQK